MEAGAGPTPGTAWVRERASEQSWQARTSVATVSMLSIKGYSPTFYFISNHHSGQLCAPNRSPGRMLDCQGMEVLRAYKTELDLNHRQITACRQHVGVARWAYNWGLTRLQEHYQRTGKSLSAIDLHKELVQLKKTEVPWLYESSKCAPQEALRNLEGAMKNFFKRCVLKKAGAWNGPLGYPMYKSKKRGLGSCRLSGKIEVFEKAIRLPRLGKLRLKERGYLPVGGQSTGCHHL
jgi:Helix-turn-helix domain